MDIRDFNGKGPDFPGPGVWRGVPNALYHAWTDAASHSLIAPMDRSPAHCLAASRRRIKPSPEMLIGSYVGDALLLPANLVDWATMPAFAGTGSRASRRDWLASIGDRQVIGADDRERADSIVADIQRSAAAQMLVGEPELTVIWEERADDGSPYWCKGRADNLWVGNAGCAVVDLKVLRDSSPYGFGRACGERGYHEAAAWYIRGFAAHGLICDAAAWVVASNADDATMADVATYGLLATHRYLRIGIDRMLSRAAAWAKCKASGHWPCQPPLGGFEIPEYRLR